MGLRENAAAAAGRTTDAAEPDDNQAAPAYVPMPDMGAYEPGPDDPDMVPVHLAWLRVRKDVRAIAKGEQYNAAGTRYNFRGVDTVVNVFGPITLRHGVSILPVNVDMEYGEKATAKGGKMRECSASVTWMIVGPMGDTLTLQTQGEALDTADKGSAKAQSVALRVLLLTSGLTPTHDKDPDASHIERGQDPVRPAVSYVDEVANPGTSPGRLRQIHHELKTTRQLGALVTNEVGDEEAIGDMVVRIGKERAAGGAE